MSRCVEVQIKVYPEGQEAGEGSFITEEYGASTICRFLTDKSPKDFCKEIHKLLHTASNGEVFSAKESHRMPFGPIDNSKEWCKYI